MRSRSKLEDVSELMQLIQLRLPVKEAARTSVLSKSWLHAWSTFPTLRFDFRDLKLADMDRTLIRYLRDNIAIESFDLMFDIGNQDQVSASLAEKCIRTVVATNTCFKELSLLLNHDGVDHVNLPYEILSAENLSKIRVKTTPEVFSEVWWERCRRGMINRVSLRELSHHPMIIKCVSLRELYLESLQVSQELLDRVLSSCSLLGKIELLYCSDKLNTIKVENLPCLYDLRIVTRDQGTTTLEINNVPNLRFFNFTCHLHGDYPVVPYNAHSMSLGSRLTQLSLGDGITDNESLDKLLSGLPFLESLTLFLLSCELPNICFICASIKSLSLLDCLPTISDVKVYAPNLLYLTIRVFSKLPRLLFPASTLQHVTFRLKLSAHPNTSTFLNMREALTLSSKCYHLHIKTLRYIFQPLDIDIYDLRKRLRFPPMTVQELWFETYQDNCLWERSPFFDALFEIFHPNHVYAMQDSRFKDKNIFCNLMLREVLEKTTTTTTAYWTLYLKHVQIRHHQKWETLTNSHRSLLDGPLVHFKLNWG